MSTYDSWIPAPSKRLRGLVRALIPGTVFYLWFTLGLEHQAPIASAHCSRADQGAFESQSIPAQEREQAIAKELAGDGIPSWAGTYAFDSDDAAWITIAPRSGAVFFSRHYAGPHSTNDVRNHGDVEEIAPGRLRVHWLAPSDAVYLTFVGRRVPSVSADLVVVPWGRRDYLVPQERMIEFCERVNDGSAWRDRDDERAFASRVVPGRGWFDSFGAPVPNVPEEFRPCLLAHAVTASVTEVQPTRRVDDSPNLVFECETVATLDAGSDRGLQLGTTFFWPWKNNYAEGEITRLSEHESTVTFRHSVVTTLDADPLAVGTVLSTSRPK